MTTPYYHTAAFTIAIIVYAILGVITAIGCWRLCKTLKKQPLLWTIFGYLVPIIPYLILMSKRNQGMLLNGDV